MQGQWHEAYDQSIQGEAYNDFFFTFIYLCVHVCMCGSTWAYGISLHVWRSETTWFSSSMWDLASSNLETKMSSLTPVWKYTIREWIRGRKRPLGSYCCSPDNKQYGWTLLERDQNTNLWDTFGNRPNGQGNGCMWVNSYLSEAPDNTGSVERRLACMSSFDR